MGVEHLMLQYELKQSGQYISDFSIKKSMFRVPELSSSAIKYVSLLHLGFAKKVLEAELQSKAVVG